jgi:hypothetical protein
VRALSLLQPWAWIVVYGGKRIENRTWNTNVRGPFLIHASMGITRAQYDDAIDTCIALGALSVAKRVPPMEQLPRGGIVGQATLSHVHRPCAPSCGVDDPRVWRCQHAWHMPCQFGFSLVDVQPLPFLPCKGSRGWWGNFEIRDGQAVQL